MNRDEMTPEQKEAERRRERELADLRAILALDQGRRFINRLFQRARIFSTTFTGNSHSYFNEGERNLGLWIMNECEAASSDGLRAAMFEHLREVKG